MQILHKRSSFSLDINKKKALLLLSELLIWGTEIVFIMSSLHFSSALVLMIDLLVLSPLKIGRTLVYDTFIEDPDSISFKLLFRYYRFGYFKTIVWRFFRWMRIFMVALVVSFPPFLTLYYRQDIVDPVRWNAMTLLYLCFSLLGIVAVFLRTIADSLSGHLLIYLSQTRSLFRLYKDVFKSPLFLLWPLYQMCWEQLPFFVLSPLFFSFAFNNHVSLVKKSKLSCKRNVFKP